MTQNEVCHPFEYFHFQSNHALEIRILLFKKNILFGQTEKKILNFDFRYSTRKSLLFGLLGERRMNVSVCVCVFHFILHFQKVFYKNYLQQDFFFVAGQYYLKENDYKKKGK